MKKLNILVFVILLAACTVSPTTTIPAPPTGTPDLQATGTAQVYASWTEMYQTLTAQPTGTPVPTATNALPTDTPAPAEPTQTPLPTLLPGQLVALNSLHMIDAATGWGVESSGYIVRTRDGGNTWQDVTPPQGAYNETGFFALDASMAWATIKPSDSCDANRMQMTWHEYQMCMPGPNIVIWRTVDGGQTWQASEPYKAENLHYKPIAIQFIDASTGWFLYVSSLGPMGSTTMGMAQTENGGISWVDTYPPQSVCIHRAMVFANAQDGWSGYDCRFVPVDWIPLKDFVSGKFAPELYRTSSGAKSAWNVADTLPSPQVFPAELTAPNADPNLLIFCGTTSMERISPQAFTMQWTCSSNYGASPLTDFNYQYLTPDGGQSWHSWLATGNENFISATTGWRLSAIDKSKYNLEQTTDSGYTWSQIKTVQWGGTLDFVNEMEGWALASSEDVTTLVHTKDGGKTWEEIKPVITP